MIYLFSQHRQIEYSFKICISLISPFAFTTTGLSPGVVIGLHPTDKAFCSSDKLLRPQTIHRIRHRCSNRLHTQREQRQENHTNATADGKLMGLE